ncbi:unnamed protein product [Oikopleura dioica]|uniref:CUB domain-containing protein n=1 Tax=Oikopleura dioica TaxID=34765 RepID=E4X695_OIKDI|nr:unnamed protein product [Oikopleura dioica]
MKISASLIALAAAVPAKDPKNGKFVQDADAPRFNCGITQITDNAIITSPGFDDPGHYSNNLDCLWEINIAGVSGFIIHPEFFEVENHDVCNYDSLSIRWWEEEEIHLENSTASEVFNYKFCSPDSIWDGITEPYTATMPTSTSYYDSSGSSFSTTAYPTSTSTEYDYPSGGDYYDSYGSSYSYYSSGSSGNSYSSSSSSNSSGRKRRAPVEGTLNDSAGGDGRSSSIYIGDFSAPLEISGGSAKIRFQTDSSVVLRGFKLRIEKGNSISPDGCDQVQFGSGSVTSPNFPARHGNNELCKYKLNADPGKMIKITFDKFDVEKENWCQFDSLSIMGRKHCGQEDTDFGEKKMPMKTVLINSDSTELVWQTDGSVAHGGFSFSWESVDNPITFASPPLESAAGFHDHMELFRSQLVYQMEFERPFMIKALNRYWEKIQVTDEYFQTSGNCDWVGNTPKYQTFDFKDFDASETLCTNLRNFANNAQQFVLNFVCMDNHEVPKRTFNRWMKMGSNIHRIAADHDGFCNSN